MSTDIWAALESKILVNRWLSIYQLLVHFLGHFTGLLTGALTGLLTGSLAGALTGGLTGSLTGALTGWLTGALTEPVGYFPTDDFSVETILIRGLITQEIRFNILNFDIPYY